jgi:hypothetical protein
VVLNKGSEMSDKQEIPDPRKVLQRSARIVYDKASGKIVHMHKTMWRRETEAPSASEIDADARRTASKVQGLEEGTLDILTVNLDELDRNTKYGVDIRTKNLLKLE